MILGIKYCVPRYPAGDTFTLAPSYPCEYGFTPTQTEVTIAGADVMEVNFTARRLTYAIYGVVTAGGDVPLSGVVVNLKESIVGDTGLIASTTTDSSGRYQFAMLENGFYRVSTEENCFAETGLEMVVVFCENKEVNFECRIFSETEKSEEKKSILRELNRLRGIDNKGRQADNGDMETQGTGKDNPSAFSLQASSRTEASVPTYLFYHWDHLGTVRLITSSTGTVVSRHDYEPFGVEIPPYPTGASDTAKNTHQYTGHERDKATGYDYMHARYYGSSMGRFMKPDNMITDAMNPQSWNLYSYVNGNPVNFNDPTGHMGNVPLSTKQLRFAPPGGTIWNVLESGGISFSESLFGGQIGVVHLDWPSSLNQDSEQNTGSVGRDTSFGNYEFQVGEYTSGEAGSNVSPEINLYTVHANEYGDWPHSALSATWESNAIGWWSFGGLSGGHFGSEDKFLSWYPGYSVTKTTILGSKEENARAASLILSTDESSLLKYFNMFFNCSFTSGVIIGKAYGHPELPLSGFASHPELLLWWVHRFLPYRETTFTVPPSH